MCDRPIQLTQNKTETSLAGFCLPVGLSVDYRPFVRKPTQPRLNYKVVCCPQLSSLQTENTSLRWQTPSGQQHSQGPLGRHPTRGGRAMSMYETGSAPRHFSHRVETARHDDGVVLQPFPTNVSIQAPRFLLMIVQSDGAWPGAGVGFSFVHSIIYCISMVLLNLV